MIGKHYAAHLKRVSVSYPSIHQHSNLACQLLYTFLLAFLLTSCLLRASNLRSYVPQVCDGVFTRTRFLTVGGAVHAVHIHAEHALLRDDALFCDRSHPRTDVCVGKGDVRVVGGSGHGAGPYEVVIFADGGQERTEMLKPYTRKWEESVMNTIDEVKVMRKVKTRAWAADQELKVAADPLAAVAAQLQGQATALDQVSPICDVQHAVPAILLSTGGYTGNVYHEFNDGIIPLFITAQKYSPGQVVLLLLEYHNWWMTKYAEIMSQITNYTVIDLARDKRVHCFPEVTVGLLIHDELSIHEAPLQRRHNHGASMQGFQSMLHAAYLPRLPREEFPQATTQVPKLAIISRSSPRALLNQQDVIAVAEEIGYSVQVLAPTPSTEMVDMYRELSRCDVMLGVHGAAMPHLLFLRPGATFIQVVPLGTAWAAATYYGEPAQKLGLNYVAYNVSAIESSLWHKYARDDPVLVRPESVNEKGWAVTKSIYLEGQDVTVSLAKIRALLRSAYAHAAALSSS